MKPSAVGVICRCWGHACDGLGHRGVVRGDDGDDGRCDGGALHVCNTPQPGRQFGGADLQVGQQKGLKDDTQVNGW